MKDALHNIVLVGFMGTGKSTVGRLVAEDLGWSLVELDDEIERVEGRSISLIFAQQGEGYFREVEHRLVAEFSNHEQVVLSCGGGVVLDPVNIENLEHRGLLVCLTADETALMKRLRGDTNRPLLEDADRTARLRELLVQRKPLYNRLPHQVETTGKSPEVIKDEVIALWESHKHLP